MMAAWSKIYAAFIRRRFSRASRGGEGWPALALSTIERRRKGKKQSKKASSLARDTRNGGQLVSAGGLYAILQDSGRLYRQLAPGIEVLSPTTAANAKFEATVTFGGTSYYPGGDRVSVADIMGFHQKGGGHVPKREILVQPDDRTGKAMESAAKRIIKSIDG